MYLRQSPEATGSLKGCPETILRPDSGTGLALQIGLVDMLKEEYGIEPAGMLGHSAGEIPCGYADGCLTREQTILIAYHRGESRLPSCRGP